MSPDRALDAASLYRQCPPDDLPFTTTAELDGASGSLFGQARARESIAFGVAMQQPGHNLFVMGPPGTGRRRFVNDYLAEVAAAREAPSDWCYVNHFEQSERPRALQLPAGAGPRLARQVDGFIADVQAAVSAAFSSEEYRARRAAIEREFQERQGEALESVQARARELNIRIMQTPGGMMFAPVEDGEVIGPEDFEKLPPERQQAVKESVEAVGRLFQDSMRDLPERLRESRQRLRDLDREVAEFAIGHHVIDLEQTWHAMPEVVEWIKAMHSDLAEHYEILQEQEQPPEGIALMPANGEEDHAVGRARRRYGINVLISNDPHRGAPVVFEERPSYGRLIGKIEHRARFGALLTDYHLIRAGALHEANGGYLVMQADRLLAEPLAWDALKECLRAQAVKIVPLDQLYGLVSTTSLEPAPIPLAVKIILIGNPRLYYLLAQLDPEFEDHFKVVAEFDDRAVRSPSMILDFARLLAAACGEESLPPLARDAVARMVEEAAREAEDSERLSTEIRRSIDLAREACHWAAKRGAATVEATDVDQAIEHRAFRRGRVRDRVLEEIERGTVAIATSGTRVGQINGLAVLSLGDQSFGRPSRISVRVGLGNGRIVDIEREAELGGALHSKGLLILSGYIAARYAQQVPASFAATVTFEQSYGGIDGDSASSTELFALLSALADIPIAQRFAVTGSVNQFGEIQAIGGVNHKIEGFFDLCDRRGLSGDQGVLIPEANVKHLMLRPRVVTAVASGRFHIHAIATINQGLELLTGTPAGAVDDNGEYPEGSVNRMVVKRLARYAERRRRFGQDSDVGLRRGRDRRDR